MPARWKCDDIDVQTLRGRPPCVANRVANRSFLKATLSLDLGLSASSRQRHNELGIAVHYDVGVVCDYDDLPALLDGA